MAINVAAPLWGQRNWSQAAAALSGYSLVTPELLASRKLLKRVDTKFLFNRRLLESILSELPSSYGLLGSANSPWQNYRSDYFDTEDLLFFHDHRRGRRIRHKVRLRHYLDRHLTFLEVKKRDRPGSMIKQRRELPFQTLRLTRNDWAFVEEAVASPQKPLVSNLGNKLGLKLRTAYSRITLVGLDTVERVTFDFDLELSANGRCVSFRDAVIAEVKQEKFRATTPAMCVVRDHGLRPSLASKYCIGMMVLSSALRSNRLKPRLRAIKGVNDG